MSERCTKQDRPDDLPPFDVDAARHRLLTAALNGAPASFVAMMDGLGLDVEPGQLAREVFAAYEEAARLDEVIDEFRRGGMATVMMVAEHIERSHFAARAAQRCESQAAISMSRIEDFTRRYGGLEDSPRRPLHELVADCEAWRTFLAKARSALDGRGAARSRMRLFANEIAPRFFALCPRTLSGSQAFEQFMRAAVELMAGSCPDGSLIRSVSRDIAARQ